jgi:hypothetical protein
MLFLEGKLLGEVFTEIWTPDNILLEKDYYKNTIATATFRGLARATNDGIFKGTTGGVDSEPATDIAFLESITPAAFQGKKVSDDTNGIDLFDGGVGDKTYAEWRSYMIAASNVTIEQIQLGRGFTAPTGVNIQYARVSVNKPLTTGLKYIIRYRISMI